MEADGAPHRVYAPSLSHRWRRSLLARSLRLVGSAHRGVVDGADGEGALAASEVGDQFQRSCPAVEDEGQTQAGRHDTAASTATPRY